MTPYYYDDSITLHHGDCIEVLCQLDDNSVDAVVTDPPYGLEFMGKDWDAPWKQSGADVGRGVKVAEQRAAEMTERGRGHSTSAGPYLAARVDSICAAGRPFQEWCTEWTTECLRVLKPGGYILAFGGSRTWHRLAAAVEDAGFEIRDSIAWLYGSGFPKSLDVSKAIDNAAGAEREVLGPGKYASRRPRDSGPGSTYGGGINNVRPPVSTPATAAAAAEWAGWGTALKPAFEPIVVGRKPLAGSTVAANVLEHGTGALNINGCRTTPAAVDDYGRSANKADGTNSPSRAIFGGLGPKPTAAHGDGRWPTNVLLDESQADALDEQTGVSRSRSGKPRKAASGEGWRMAATGAEYDDSGGASRFFPTFRYQAKAPADERPTYQPTRLRLRSDLTPEQVDRVTTRLREAGVDVA